VEKYVKENKLTFTVVWLDPSSTAGESVGKDYKVTAIPRVLIIDKGGVIRADFTGLQPKSELLKELKKVGL
jgi:thioredoxin-like negative regulator of GroEL